jgi:hypothetical protein
MYKTFIKIILINVVVLNGISSVTCEAAFEDLLEVENQARFKKFDPQQQQLIKSLLHQQSEKIANEIFIDTRWISEDAKRIAYNKISDRIMSVCVYGIVEHPEIDDNWRRAFRHYCTLIMDTLENEINQQLVPLAPARYPAMAIQPPLPKVGVAKQQTIEIMRQVTIESAKQGLNQIGQSPIFKVGPTKDINEPILPNNDQFDIYDEPHHSNLGIQQKKGDQEIQEFAKKNNLIKKDDGSDRHS